ncbi:MAG: methionine--tRNA ligase [Candidatus Firestonebacteria bacterium RIFOXYA2_FULL_40_8]|nr:MAG: methionine--tRNA ligase [Candidatus Firestonebacteria bacterium RIFOXYA2_FULL_40_8]
MKNKFYISTAIPYVNARPHIGHALEYVQTDVVARYQRQQGKDVYFLTGTDENSLKNVKAAEKAGLPVKEYVDAHYPDFYNFKTALNISFDDFIRTTELRHFQGAQKLWQTLQPEDIYKKKYQGRYCVGCEAFLTDEELVDGLCPDHKTEPELVEEENYFFRLSRYQQPLLDILRSGQIKIIPDFRKNEWLAFIERGLEDISISRSVARAHGWGVPVPGDDSQIMYVWVDALSNYITALDYENKGDKFVRYWQQEDQPKREVVHVIGKGIGKFHVVYWLAFLLSAGVKLPTVEFIHGYVTANGEKISKSLGNVIDPYEVVEKYGTDAVRYYLLQAIPAHGDGNYSEEIFQELYQAHLVNGVGNLTSRVLTMIEKYSQSEIPALAPDTLGLENFWTEYHHWFAEYNFTEVTKLTNALVTRMDQQISENKPWEKVKQGIDILPWLYQWSEGLRHLALALLPLLPTTAEKILSGLNLAGQSQGQTSEWGRLIPGTKINKGEQLFPRLD